MTTISVEVGPRREKEINFWRCAVLALISLLLTLATLFVNIHTVLQVVILLSLVLSVLGCIHFAKQMGALDDAVEYRSAQSTLLSIGELIDSRQQMTADDLAQLHMYTEVLKKNYPNTGVSRQVIIFEKVVQALVQSMVPISDYDRQVLNDALRDINVLLLNHYQHTFAP